MLKKITTLTLISLSITISIMLILSSIFSEKELRPVLINDEAINFELGDIDGNIKSLEQYKGNTIVINFWTSWCPYCLKEIPVLIDAYNNYDNSDLTILGINSSRLERNTEDAHQLIKELEIPYPIVFDYDHQISTNYNLIGLPYTVIIDQNFKIKHIITGGFDKQLLEDILNELL